MYALNRKFQKLEDLQCLKSEMDLRQELVQRLATDRAKQELANATGIDDAELNERLFKAGFTAETIPALAAAPIALVAWGSGQVTREELTVAMQAIHDSEVAEQHSAIAKFRSWLETRPGSELFCLWKDFIRARARNFRSSDQNSDRMIHWVTQVALTSGGVLGFGAICTGERAIIQRVRDVLQGDTGSGDSENTDQLHEIV